MFMSEQELIVKLNKKTALTVDMVISVSNSSCSKTYKKTKELKIKQQKKGNVTSNFC